MIFNELETKGDYINYCLQNCDDIEDIDIVIPNDVYRSCKEIGVATSNLVTVYYMNGTITYENIVALCLINYKRIQNELR